MRTNASLRQKTGHGRGRPFGRTVSPCRRRAFACSTRCCWSATRTTARHRPLDHHRTSIGTVGQAASAGSVSTRQRTSLPVLRPRCDPFGGDGQGDAVHQRRPRLTGLPGASWGT